MRFPCVHAVATTPAQRLGVSLRSFTQPYQPSPKTLSGRPAHCPFRGLLGVHSRYGLYTRAVTVFRDTLPEGFSHVVTSIAAPVASGWSGCRVGLAPTGKRRLSTAHGYGGRKWVQGVRTQRPSHTLTNETNNVTIFWRQRRQPKFSRTSNQLAVARLPADRRQRRQASFARPGWLNMALALGQRRRRRSTVARADDCASRAREHTECSNFGQKTEPIPFQSDRTCSTARAVSESAVLRILLLAKPFM